MKNVTMDNPLTTQEIYDELFNFKESLKQLTDQFGELANGVMLSLANDRPKGEWKKNTTVLVTGGEHVGDQCSECKELVAWGWADRFNFCPFCGADMRGEETDES